MMTAPAAFRRHRKRGGESPSFFFFLCLLPSWEKGFPSGTWPPWHGRGEIPSHIGSVSLSLSVSAFSDSALSPFLIFPEIHNSDWGWNFNTISTWILAFLQQKKGINRLSGPLGHRLVLIFLPKNHICSKKIFVSFYPVWTLFDMDLLRNKKHATNKNWHWINMLAQK